MMFGQNICSEQLEFEQYGEDFQKTDGKPMFLTIDMDTSQLNL